MGYSEPVFYLGMNFEAIAHHIIIFGVFGPYAPEILDFIIFFIGFKSWVVSNKMPIIYFLFL